MFEAQVFKGKGKSNNCWRWRIVGANDKKVATSGEAFSSKATAKRALANVLNELALGRVTTKVLEPKKATKKEVKKVTKKTTKKAAKGSPEKAKPEKK